MSTDEDNDYDVLVLGAGNAGMAAASIACEAGLRTAIVESHEAGGVCPTRGCVPKKVLVAAAQTLDAISRAGSHQIRVGPPALDWPGLVARKESFVEGVPGEFEASLARRGIDLLRGTARFLGPHDIGVDGAAYRARRIVVATGSSPRALPIPGAELLLSSDELLDLLELPDSITFIGAGVIAFEFAHVLARAGVHVTLLEVADRVLPALDMDAATEVEEATRKLGVDVASGVSIERIRRVRGGCEVAYRTRDGRARVVSCSVAAHGAGRVANLAGLDLHLAGISLDGGRVERDAFLRSVENADVYFAGDALTGVPQLSPLASYEGRIVGNNLTQESSVEVRYGHQPAAIYTIPAAAMVGLTEEGAREQGLDFEAHVNDMREWRSARTYAEDTAWAKVLVERETDRILGAHLVGHGAEETIHAFALAIERGMTASDLRSRVYAYPTFHSDIKYLVG